MRSVVNLGGSDVAARVIIKEDDKGKFHWDMSIHAVNEILDSAKEDGITEVTPFLDAAYKSDALLEDNRLAGIRPDLPTQDKAYSPTEIILDDGNSNVNMGMVLNLFIEGEEPEFIGDEYQEDSLNWRVFIPVNFNINDMACIINVEPMSNQTRANA